MRRQPMDLDRVSALNRDRLATMPLEVAEHCLVFGTVEVCPCKLVLAMLVVDGPVAEGEAVPDTFVEVIVLLRSRSHGSLDPVPTTQLGRGYADKPAGTVTGYPLMLGR